MFGIYLFSKKIFRVSVVVEIPRNRSWYINNISFGGCLRNLTPSAKKSVVDYFGIAIRLRTFKMNFKTWERLKSQSCLVNSLTWSKFTNNFQYNWLQSKSWGMSFGHCVSFGLIHAILGNFLREFNSSCGINLTKPYSLLQYCVSKDSKT